MKSLEKCENSIDSRKYKKKNFTRRKEEEKEKVESFRCLACKNIFRLISAESRKEILWKFYVMNFFDRFNVASE